MKMAPPRHRDGDESSSSEASLSNDNNDTSISTSGEKLDSVDDHAGLRETRKDGKDEEISQVIEEERPRLKEVLREFRDRAEDVRDKVAALARRAKEEQAEDPGPRDDGASLLAAKQMLLLSYCRELCTYVAAKGRGKAFRGEGASWRLVELRTVMEKMRPLEKKLKYQTDKLLRLAAAPNSSLGIDGMEASADQGGEDAEDPLSFRPRPEAMAPWGEGDAGVSEETTQALKRNRGGDDRINFDDGRAPGETELYRAPRLASAPYEEDEPGAAREKRRLDKRRNKLRRGEVMEALRDEFGEQPEEITASWECGSVRCVRGQDEAHSGRRQTAKRFRGGPHGSLDTNTKSKGGQAADGKRCCTAGNHRGCWQRC
ncbi:unnamed protein product [Ascophyllum nodosum]